MLLSAEDAFQCFGGKNLFRPALDLGRGGLSKPLIHPLRQLAEFRLQLSPKHLRFGIPHGVLDEFVLVPSGSSTVEIDFVPDGDETIIRLRHTGLPSAKTGRFHRWGWKAFLPRLQAVIAGNDPGPEPDPTALLDLWRTA